MRTHTYQHTFSNGRVITMKVKLSDPPVFLNSVDNFFDNAPPEIKAEYERWLNDVVFPDVAERTP